MLSFSFNVYALKRSSNDLKNRSKCAKVELAKAKTDGGIESVSCFNSYNDAKTKMNELGANISNAAGCFKDLAKLLNVMRILIKRIKKRILIKQMILIY